MDKFEILNRACKTQLSLQKHRRYHQQLKRRESLSVLSEVLDINYRVILILLILRTYLVVTQLGCRYFKWAAF